MAVQQDVYEFLRPLDTRLALLAVGEGMVAAYGEKDLQKPIADAVASVFSWLADTKKPMIRLETLAKYNRIKRRDRALYLSVPPEPLDLLVTVLYMRARAALASPGGGFRSLNNVLKANLSRVEPVLGSLDADFLGSLLLETEIRALQDQTFGQALDEASRELASIVPSVESIADQLVALRRKGGGGADCECVVSACNAYGQCRNFCIGSWWKCLLIAIGIIVIIIFG